MYGRLLLTVARHGLCNESEDSFDDENTEPARVPKLAGGELATRTIRLGLGTTRNVFSFILKFSYWTWQITFTKPIPAAP